MTCLTARRAAQKVRTGLSPSFSGAGGGAGRSTGRSTGRLGSRGATTTRAGLAAGSGARAAGVVTGSAVGSVVVASSTTAGLASVVAATTTGAGADRGLSSSGNGTASMGSSEARRAPPDPPDAVAPSPQADSANADTTAIIKTGVRSIMALPFAADNRLPRAFRQALWRRQAPGTRLCDGFRGGLAVALVVRTGRGCAAGGAGRRQGLFGRGDGLLSARRRGCGARRHGGALGGRSRRRGHCRRRAGA